MFRQWHDSGLSQLLLSFLNPKERLNTALVSKKWKTEVEHEGYWNKQLQLIWPTFAARNKTDNKKWFLLLKKHISKVTKEKIKSEDSSNFNFYTVLKVIYEIPAEYRDLFISLIPQGEINQFFESNPLYRIILDLSPSTENMVLKYFSTQLRAETDSGFMLHACVGSFSTLNKKEYLRLFTDKQLLSFCNDLTTRSSLTNFYIISNYLLLNLGIKIIDLEISHMKNNSNNFLDRFVNKISPPASEEDLSNLKYKLINGISILRETKDGIINELEKKARDKPQLRKICDEIIKQMNDLYGKLMSDHKFSFNTNNVLSKK